MGTQRKIIFASHNANKLKEIRELLPNFEVIGLHDLGFKKEIAETGKTLQENAFIKAKYIWDTYKLPCFADDTGLEVAALNGAPGVYSARYGGVEKDAQKNMNLLLKNLEPYKKPAERTAHFKTNIVFFDEKANYFEGICKGEILLKASGNKGFGYDPIFKPLDYEKSFAEMDLKTKNKCSHRAKAIQKFLVFLKKYYIASV